MRTFTLYVQDDRYSIPTIVFATVVTEARARELAHDQLEASPHHLSVEVREEDRFLFSIRVEADRTRASTDHRNGPCESASNRP